MSKKKFYVKINVDTKFMVAIVIGAVAQILMILGIRMASGGFLATYIFGPLLGGVSMLIGAIFLGILIYGAWKKNNELVNLGLALLLGSFVGQIIGTLL